MCGIAGISAPRATIDDIRAMIATLEHRGPDNQGTWISPDGSCAFGHARLSILDPSPAGHQPMMSHDGRFCLCYNGEVYNFPDLRRELEARNGRINWRSDSDSEVILEGVAREGIGFLSRLNGIFAILVFDLESRLLYALRDPLGVKPLFVTRAEKAVSFASEIKGFDPLAGVDKRIRLASIADQLALMYVPEPHTLFEGITKIAPGVLQVYRAGELLEERGLFDDLIGLPDPDTANDDGYWIEAFGDAFRTAVGRQVISDVPVGLMLSGGLDSSAVAHELSAQGANVQEAFTISVSSDDRRLDGQSDDLSFAQLVAKKYGIRLNVIEARPEFISDIGQIIRFFEDGYSDPAAINTYLISTAARQMGIKVLLTGQGADEFLFGYRRYVAAPALMRLPNATSPLARRLNALLPSRVIGSFNSPIRRLKRTLGVAGLSRKDRLLSLYSWATPDTVREMLQSPGDIAPLSDLRAILERPKGASLLNRMSYTDIRYDLLALNLTYCDRMSMAAGVEARVPFLDFDLVRIMSRIPETMKLRSGTTKYVLKKSMEGKLPHDVIYREKAGFSLPLRAWLGRGEMDLESIFNPERLRRQGIFNPDYWQQTYEEFSAGRNDLVYPIFSFYCLQHLLESHGF